MSNIAFDLEVFKQVSATVPVPGNAITFAALGSIGPDLFQYVPISSDLSTALNTQIQTLIKSLTPAQIKAGTPPPLNFTLTTAQKIELLEKPLMAAYSILFSQIVVPFWPIFQRDVDLLNQLQTAANNQDSDALQALASSTNELTTDADQLKNIVGVSLVVKEAIGEIVALAPVIEATGPQAKPWLTQTNRPFEFLRWHYTDVFAQKLVELASTKQQQAYAYGHLCHVAASVTGKPFINNIVGGPYRTHWWRNRLVSNFVDAWTWGRYETPGAAPMAGPTGDTPTPPYAMWTNICNANLQDKFNVAGLTAPAGQLPDAVTNVATGQLGMLPGQFPQDLANYIQAAIAQAYPASKIKAPPGLTAQAVQEAFVGLFAVVWFMTSGFGPMTTFTLGPAPSSCTTPPSWVTSSGPPPSPQQSGPSTGATVTGVLLAILALLLFLTQNWAGGAAAVVGAIAAFASGGSIDWDQLACNLFWLRSGLLNAENALVSALVSSGLAYPAPGTLGIGDGTHPFLDLGGSPLTKSSAVEVAVMPYPRQLDPKVNGTADLNFGSFPASPAETPQTMNFPLTCYAEKVVDLSGLQNGGLLNGGAFPSGNTFFGDAVSNAKKLIAEQAKKLPRYNLDADRGYGWQTWDPQVNSLPGNGQVVNPKQEI